MSASSFWSNETALWALVAALVLCTTAVLCLWLTRHGPERWRYRVALVSQLVLVVTSIGVAVLFLWLGIEWFALWPTVVGLVAASGLLVWWRGHGTLATFAGFLAATLLIAGVFNPTFPISVTPSMPIALVALIAAAASALTSRHGRSA